MTIKTQTLNALVVEGGAIRSIYSAGLLDGFLQNNFNPFHQFYGVSAGAYNLTGYLNGIPGISLDIYQKLITDNSVISFSKFIAGEHLINLNKVEDIIFKHPAMNLNNIFKQERVFFITLTDVNTGSPVHIKSSIQNIKQLLKVSAALPFIHRGFPIFNGREMIDGGIADGIPLATAINNNATNIMVIRSRHRTYRKKDTLMHKYIRWQMRHAPELKGVMKRRIQIYEDTLNLIQNPPRHVRVTEVCPPESFKMPRISKNPKHIMQGFEAGMNDASSIIQKWQNSLARD